MRRVLVIAPHPDDETLGCGGTLLRHRRDGDSIHWVIVTGMDRETFGEERCEARAREIAQVRDLYGFVTVRLLDFPTTRLDAIPLGNIVGAVKEAIGEVEPDTIYVPYCGDVHTDHRVVFDAVASCTKWFRCPGIRRILVYETLSETEFGINPDSNGFRPNVLVDISAHLEKKIEILNVFSSELGTFPFPRSIETVRALAALRGATAGCAAAESFMLLKELI